MNFKYYKSERLIALVISLSIVFSLISKWLIDLLKMFHLVTEINENIHLFSTLSFFTFFFIYLNYYGWKNKLFKWLIDIPNLNGRYLGDLVSSFTDTNGNPIVKRCAIEIKQTSSSIHVFSYYGDYNSEIQTSRSYSVSEEIVKENNGFFKIYYIFTNEPGTLQTQLNNHSGSVCFKYYPDIKSLDGEYYNQRKNIGTIRVHFDQLNLVGRLTL